MSLFQHVGGLLRLPPEHVIQRILGRGRREVSNRIRRKRDLQQGTFERHSPVEALLCYFPPLDVCLLESRREETAALAQHYLDHRFGLLGSGWTQVRHGMRCRGLEGHRFDMGVSVEADNEGEWLAEHIDRANLAESQRIWRLVFAKRDAYVPIDWQLDFKSGYRWSEAGWYRNAPFGHKPGLDIKVPWELARMQHLPQLAWAYALAETERPTSADVEPPERYVLEFRSQVLDFIATNPPRFGVNWTCAMDVAIRVANWLVAYDLFRSYGAVFDGDFQEVFGRSVYEHGKHIVTNLEWSEVSRGNHYLSDIVGLLFVAAYLPRSAETDAWLAFAVQQLIIEVGFQFHSDGSNFEASTCYHRLSAELVVYGTALVLGLPEEKRSALQDYDHRLVKGRPSLQPAPITHHPLPLAASAKTQPASPFPPWYFERLEKIAEFTVHVTKPSGRVAQIGDNDSGRFLKLQPVHRRSSVIEAKDRYANLQDYAGLPDEATYWDEDHLDQRHLVAAVNGLFRREDFNAFVGEGWLESELVSSLAGGLRLSSYLRAGEATAAERARVVDAEVLERGARHEAQAESRHRWEITIPGQDIRAGLRFYAYPDFGLYIYRSHRLYLAVRCRPAGQHKFGHAHNDQLALELSVDGEDWLADPGTYLYTSLPERRNAYRSARAHCAPSFPEEPGDLGYSVFRIVGAAQTECLHAGPDGFYGIAHAHGQRVSRSITITANSVIIADSHPPLCEGLDKPGPAAESIPFSKGYGIREHAKDES